jgi:hypothetical protein
LTGSSSISTRSRPLAVHRYEEPRMSLREALHVGRRPALHARSRFLDEHGVDHPIDTITANALHGCEGSSAARMRLEPLPRRAACLWPPAGRGHACSVLVALVHQPRLPDSLSDSVMQPHKTRERARIDCKKLRANLCIGFTF